MNYKTYFQQALDEIGGAFDGEKYAYADKTDVEINEALCKYLALADKEIIRLMLTNPK